MAGKRIRWNPELAKQACADKGVTLLSDFVKTTDKISIRFNKCGHTSDTWLHNVLKGTGCKTCWAENVGKMNKGKTKWNTDSVNEVLSGIGLKLTTPYVNADTKVSVTCKHGHVYDGLFYNIRKTEGCVVCNGWAVSDESAEKLIGLSGFTLLSPYKGCHAHIDIQCPSGHVTKTTYTEWKSKKHCIECNRLARAQAYKDKVKTMVDSIGYTLITCGDIKKEGFTAQCDKGHVRHYNFFNFQKGHYCGVCAGRIADTEKIAQAFINKGYTQLSDYIDAKTPIKFRCDAGHEHQMIATQIIRGDMCGVCYGRYVTTNQVKESLDTEDYTLISEYVRASAPLTYICPNNHTHTASWLAWQSGNRCPYCSGRAVDPSYVKEYISSFGYTLLSEYDKCDKKLTIKCDLGHIYNQTWDDFKAGCRCNKCASHGFKVSKPGILYYLKFMPPGIDLYKIGITNRTVEERFKSEPTPYAIIKTVYYSDGLMCYQDEQAILRMYRDAAYTAGKPLVSGNSELFKYDVLELDR